MKSFKCYLNEKYMERSSGCFMAEFTPDSVRQVQDVIDLIHPDDVYLGERGKYGKEEVPHITIRYGVLLDNVNQIPTELIKSMCIKSVIIDGVGIFENDEFDVVYLKLRETPKMFLNIRDWIHANLPCTPLTYPEYIPHITLSYVRKGSGVKYLNLQHTEEWQATMPKNLLLDSLVYSRKDAVRLVVPFLEPNI